MLDVAQNTARLNSLIGKYYSAEFQLEEKTESKLQLSQLGAQATIDKNNDSLEILNRYDKLSENLANKNTTVEIWEGLGKWDITDASNYEKFMQAFDNKFDPDKNGNGKGQEGGLYAYATESTAGFSHGEILADANLINEASTNVSKNHPKPTEADYGAEPQSGDFTKEVTNEDGSKTTVPDDEKFQEEHAKWEQRKQQAEQEYARNCAGEWLETEKEALYQKYFDAKKEIYDDKQDKRYEAAKQSYQTNRTSASNMYEGYVDAFKNGKTNLADKKAEEQERLSLEFQNSQKTLSMQEAMLDQEIQQLQAQVTALKTEIDSLKQERNSNVQSDFKLFG